MYNLLVKKSRKEDWIRGRISHLTLWSSRRKSVKYRTLFLVVFLSIFGETKYSFMGFKRP